MENNKVKADRSSWGWTNERHVHFLNTMESSFVRAMLENDGHLPRLDRYLPDSSDSTLDLKTERRRRYSTSDILDRRVKTDKRSRRQLSQPYISSQDQVVPQLENGGRDKDEEGHAGVPVTPVAPTD
ncbi:hypothetical protein RJ639_027978 [Escallonia herrerae]|uniref:Uncharacterized protein n=1 Tax=Escallonia herrerae TaxID=1293975 RepID=A0AA88X640_9ASTE|nr:hypothetical protein RJ639_027978 [Escallonia herrerae]